MTIIYKNPTPVAVCVLRIAEPGQPVKLLAVKRGIEPCKGGLALPGGYVDEGESAEMAAARELLEEANLNVPVGAWHPVATRVTPDNKLLVFLLADVTLRPSALEVFVPNREVQALALVDETDDLAFSIHDQFVKTATWH